jgi:5-methylcytosine-specific restriction protein A
MADDKRIYGHKWRKARDAFLREHPFCAEHLRMGQTVAAAVVDHKTPHRGDLKLFWDRGNWQALCKHCHDSHKQRLEKSGRVAGCDANGMPLDPRHAWRREGG